MLEVKNDGLRSYIVVVGYLFRLVDWFISWSIVSAGGVASIFDDEDIDWPVFVWPNNFG